MAYVQITRRVLRDNRVPKDQDPVFGLHLPPGAEVLDVEIHDVTGWNAEKRTTRDWACGVTTIHHLGEPEAPTYEGGEG